MSKVRKLIEMAAKSASPLDVLAREALLSLGVRDEKLLAEGAALAEAAIRHADGERTDYSETFNELGIRDLNGLVRHVGAKYGASERDIATFGTLVDATTSVRNGEPLDVCVVEVAEVARSFGEPIEGDEYQEPEKPVEIDHRAEDTETLEARRDLAAEKPYAHLADPPQRAPMPSNGVEVDHLTPAARRYQREGGAMFTDNMGRTTYAFRDGTTSDTLAKPATLVSDATLPDANAHRNPPDHRDGH